MPPAEFQPTIPVGERPQTYALDRAAAGTGKVVLDRIFSHFIR